MKRIGSLFIGFVFSCAVIIAAPSVELSLHNERGATVQKVAVGVPHTLRIRVMGEHDQQPTVDLSQVVVLGTSTSRQLSFVNGKSSGWTDYLYTIRADRLGSFVIGPAKVMISGGGSIESGTYSFSVIEAPATSHDRGAWIELSSSKKKVWAGELFDISIRFGIDSSAQWVGQPSFSGGKCQVRSQGSARASQVERSGTVYQVQEQPCSLVCYEPGTQVIPAVTGSVVVPRSRRSFMDDFFDMASVFGPRGEQHAVTSNSVSIEVMPLPPHKGPVHFVGAIHSVAAEIEATQVQVGEGVVYRLVIEGVGDGQGLKQPSLTLPKDVTAYESTNRLEPVGVGFKKVFEYIVQATRPGVIKIPAQEITYFDLATETYKTSLTKQVSLTVQSSGDETYHEQLKHEQPTTSAQVPPEFSKQTSQVEASKSSIRLDLVRSRSWAWWCAVSLPNFILFMMCGVLGLLAAWYWRLKNNYRHTREGLRVYAFKIAHADLVKARNQKRPSLLYGILRGCIAHRLEKDVHELSHDDVLRTLRTAGIDERACEQLRRDLNRLAGIAFYDEQAREDVYEMVQEWLHVFERVL